MAPEDRERCHGNRPFLYPFLSPLERRNASIQIGPILFTSPGIVESDEGAMSLIVGTGSNVMAGVVMIVWRIILRLCDGYDGKSLIQEALAGRSSAQAWNTIQAANLTLEFVVVGQLFVCHSVSVLVIFKRGTSTLTHSDVT